MSRFYFHLVDSADILLDPEDVEMTPDAVVGAALMQARDCISGDVRHGVVDLRYRIDVHDDSGKVVHTLPFYDAVKIVGALTE